MQNKSKNKVKNSRCDKAGHDIREKSVICRVGERRAKTDNLYSPVDKRCMAEKRGEEDKKHGGWQSDHHENVCEHFGEGRDGVGGFQVIKHHRGVEQRKFVADYKKEQYDAGCQ